MVAYMDEGKKKITQTQIIFIFAEHEDNHDGVCETNLLALLCSTQSDKKV